MRAGGDPHPARPGSRRSGRRRRTRAIVGQNSSLTPNVGERKIARHPRSQVVRAIASRRRTAGSSRACVDQRRGQASDRDLLVAAASPSTSWSRSALDCHRPHSATKTGAAAHTASAPATSRSRRRRNSPLSKNRPIADATEGGCNVSSSTLWTDPMDFTGWSMFSAIGWRLPVPSNGPGLRPITRPTTSVRIHGPEPQVGDGCC